MSTAFASKVSVAAFDGLAGDKRKNLAVLAGQAEAGERYDDMAVFTAELARVVHADGGRLSVEERNLLSVAFKHSVGARRAAWRQISAADLDGPEPRDTYAKCIEQELLASAGEIIALLESSLIPKANDGGGNTEEIVFYSKMAGDYHRYVAEVNKAHGEQAAKHYSDAAAEAEKLEATNPIRLGLALNLSVCHYEILGDKQKACELAKKAFDDAIGGLDGLDEASYKDSTLILQLLRDNLTLWTEEENDADLDVEDME